MKVVQRLHISAVLFNKNLEFLLYKNDTLTQLIKETKPIIF